MVRENLARKFHPAGFEQPEGSRRNYRQAPEKLQKTFYRWVDELPESLPTIGVTQFHYKKAVQSLEDFGEISALDANSLVIGFKPKTKGQKEAGLFISACYTHSPEEIIVFDADAPEIGWIGYITKKNIFNNGRVGDWFAYDSLGLVVNNGECGDGFAAYSFGFVIAVKEPKSYGYCVSDTNVLKPTDCDRIPELKRYMEELRDLSKSIKDEESAKRFIERYGSQPKERIEQDIKRICDLI